MARSGTTIPVSAAAGTANDVAVFIDENNEVTVVDDAGIAEVRGVGCTVFFGNTAKCGTGVTQANAALGDDEIQLESSVTLTINGGSGNDTYLGGMARGGASRATFVGGSGIDAADVIDGRTGPDVVRGLGGDDTFPEGEFATGATTSAGTSRSSDARSAVDGLAGASDTLLGNGGNDRIRVADDVLDTARCGNGARDSVFVDAGLDTIVGCELVGTS